MIDKKKTAKKDVNFFYKYSTKYKTTFIYFWLGAKWTNFQNFDLQLQLFNDYFRFS